MSENEATSLKMMMLAGPMEEPGTPHVSARKTVEKHFAELRGPVYRFLCHCGVPPAESEEITQETFIRLYQELSCGASIRQVRGWIFRVAQNLRIDSSRRRSDTIVFDSEVSDRAALNFPDRSPNPEEHLLSRERKHELRRRIARLTDLQRQALYLRAEGLRYREIAEILDVEQATIVDRVRRALKNLGSGAEK